MLSEDINLEGIMTHLTALEAVAVAHSNSRSVANGFNASADYVETILRDTSLFDI